MIVFIFFVTLSLHLSLSLLYKESRHVSQAKASAKTAWSSASVYAEWTEFKGGEYIFKDSNGTTAKKTTTEDA